MAEKNYKLEFAGYFREPNWGNLPAVSGIYCIYACTYNPDKGKWSIKRLLYIGESGNVRERIPEKPQDRRNKWAMELKRGEVLCASCAKVSSADRERVEAAMIYRHKPPCNVEYVDHFPWDKTTVSTSGKNRMLAQRFTVYRND